MEELESTISELEEALQQQQAEASDAVEQWSARWSELDAIKSQLETKLEARRMVAERRLTRSNVSEILREANGMPKRN